MALVLELVVLELVQELVLEVASLLILEPLERSTPLS
jgi:hypothetical protein